MRIEANSLLKFSTNDLWEMLTGNFTLVFNDGEIETNSKETLFSSYTWDLIREHQGVELSKRHHVKTHLSTGALRSDTHLKMLTEIMWDVYGFVSKAANLDADADHDFRAFLRRRVAEISNHIYNDLTYRCEDYVTSLDILDFIEVHEHPKIKQANDTVLPIDKSINKTYKVIQDVLMSETEMPNNAISKIMRSGIANAGQINQCVGPRGYLTDVDSNIFKTPILVSYLRGIHSLHDSLIESRLASKSLIFSKEPLQQAEYFSRRLQLMNQSVQNLHLGDCGSQQYLSWNVRGKRFSPGGAEIDSDLKNLKGKFYLKEDGTLDWIRGNEDHLVGKTIKLRSPIYCQHPDRYGLCSTCFGQLSFSVFKGANIGQYCWTYVAEKSTQSVLSVKHYDGSSEVDSIYIADDLTKYLKVGTGGSSYQMSPDLKDKKVSIVINSKDAEGLNSIHQVDDVKKLNLSRVTELDEIGIQIQDEVDKFIVSIPVGMKGRKASFTYQLLEYIKKVGYVINENNCYVIDMTQWEWEQNIMVLPLKHYDMSMHSSQLANMIESTIGQMRTRDTEVSPDAFLVELFDLVNSKLVVNLAVLEVVLYGIMVVSALEENYSLPKPYTDRGLGVMRLVMMRRSLSALLAYEGQKNAIIDPINYVGKNRMPHIFDDLVMPEILNKK